jgi:ribonuclease VapC
MVIDTSALIAILTSEPEVDAFLAAIDADQLRLVSAASVLESAIVLGNKYGDGGSHELDLLIAKVPLTVVPVDLDQLEWARHAFLRFGRRRHAAGLNFGDCFSYALSKSSGEPLLFKGVDFGRTDVQTVF